MFLAGGDGLLERCHGLLELRCSREHVLVILGFVALLESLELRLHALESVWRIALGVIFDFGERRLDLLERIVCRPSLPGAAGHEHAGRGDRQDQSGNIHESTPCNLSLLD
jgi:hypothetical protein